jgi:two-component system response regulator HydG
MERIKILIVEDEFIVANDLRIMLKKAGYMVTGIAPSTDDARRLIRLREPDWVLIDIILKGTESGIDLAGELHKQKIPFLFISANTNQATLEQAKATEPYGFLVKPFRERDLFVMLDIARYRYDLDQGKLLANTPLGSDAVSVEGIVGRSPVLMEVLQRAHMVGPSDASVLILGESGTGKERMARAIHQLSYRREGPYVVVNCGALPATLVESELFGHEKGAFTGANQRRAGKFEQAHNGTLFLDEIGELPLDAQSRLLRVLQEKEIERLGGGAVTKVDVRVIAATNRNLQKEVGEGRFRLDLYYRLNVFPIELPALRQRKEDLPALADYFVKISSHKNRKHVTAISAEVMGKMMKYDWPGNIRELEHFIERQILMARRNVIDDADLPESAALHLEAGDNSMKTLEQMEREHILKALKLSGGRVSGAGGAAESLDIHASTLYSKMKKLGIQWDYE